MFFVLPIEFIVEGTESNEHPLTLESIHNALTQAGFEVDLVNSPVDKKKRLHVKQRVITPSALTSFCSDCDCGKAEGCGS